MHKNCNVAKVINEYFAIGITVKCFISTIVFVARIKLCWRYHSLPLSQRYVLWNWINIGWNNGSSSPLSQPMLISCQLYHKEHISMKFYLIILTFHNLKYFRNIISKMAVVCLSPNVITDPMLSSHYNDVIMGAIAFQITSLTIVYSIVYSDADQRKHQSSASLAFVRGIHRGPMNSPHKWPVTRKMFPFDDVIMTYISTSVIIRDGLWRVTIHVQIAYCHQMIKWNMKLDDSVRAPRAPIG